jgi:hypothetical protein
MAENLWGAFLDARARCIDQFYLEGKSDAQIADTFRMDSAQVHLIRTRRRFSSWLDRQYWQEISGKACTITLERRPTYCDRGNFLAKLHPAGPLALEIDGQDGWPRYYFDEDRAKAECEAWLRKRGQWRDA